MCSNIPSDCQYTSVGRGAGWLETLTSDSQTAGWLSGHTGTVGVRDHESDAKT